jgi:hypothetical protein
LQRVLEAEGIMKAWSLGLMGAALALVMTACPSGRGSNPGAIFPVKAGETWTAEFTVKSQKLTVGFQLDGPADFDEDGDVVADFATTGNVKGGFGYVLTKDNVFVSQFSLNPADKTNLICGATNDGNLAKGVKGVGFLYQNGKSVGELACTLQRIK